MLMRTPSRYGAHVVALLLAACGTAKTPLPPPHIYPISPSPLPSSPALEQSRFVFLQDKTHAQEAVITALGLVDSGYRFGGRNPEAGLDCSGMVSYVYEKAAQLKLPHNAAQMARITRPVARNQLRPGDLVFFDTSNKPYSHVGLYIGQGRFVHAPSSRGKVQISSLDSGWFSKRFQAGHTLVAD